MKLMLYDNCKGMPPELAIVLFGIHPRQIGMTFERERVPARVGVLKKLTLYLWKYYRVFAWF